MQLQENLDHYRDKLSIEATIKQVVSTLTATKIYYSYDRKYTVTVKNTFPCCEHGNKIGLHNNKYSLE